MLFMFRLIQYNLLHFLGLYQQAAVMGIVWIKASYRNVANQNEKTGIAHRQYVESIPNWELISGFSALIFQTAFWKDSEQAQWNVLDTQHPPTRMSCTIIIKQMLLANKGAFSLVNYFVDFGVWVFQRLYVLVLIWFAKQGVLQGKNSHTQYELFPSGAVAWWPSKTGRQPSTSNWPKSDSTEGVQLKQCRITVYCAFHIIRNITDQEQQQWHSWHLHYCVYNETM